MTCVTPPPLTAVMPCFFSIASALPERLPERQNSTIFSLSLRLVHCCSSCSRGILIAPSAEPFPNSSAVRTSTRTTFLALIRSLSVWAFADTIKSKNAHKVMEYFIVNLLANCTSILFNRLFCYSILFFRALYFNISTV